MKRNISINISGIIFHIEEDGYEILRRYLDSITRYFSSFEDSSEIMADIESRIAEIFLSKLNEGKQVITFDDVNSLVATMGSVSDFKAAEDETSSQQDQGTESSTGSQANAGFTFTSNTLHRDQHRKILGGVCSGLAHYMKVDPLWVRLLFAILTFAWGITVIVYIIMWIVVPGSYELKEIETGKKMFRDPDRKVLGGVCGGISSYINVDIIAIRIIFILLTIAGGFGVFLYIILWVILPEAKTLTDKLQMQGEAVTLSNIESNIKKNQTLSGNDGETTITKILLFPFRFLAIVLNTLAKVIAPLVEALRVVFGILIVMVGVGFLFSIIIASGIGLGLITTSAGNFPWADQAELSMPIDAFLRAFPSWVLVAGVVAAIIPSLYLILLGISVAARRIVFTPTVGWSLFVALMVCVALLSVGIPKIVMAFKEEGEVRKETNFSPKGMAYIKLNETGMDDYHATFLNLRGHEETYFKLVQVFKAQGTTRQKAIENTKMVDYNVSLSDSVFTFDSNLTFKPDAIFRAQELKMTLYVPFNKPFVLEPGMVHLLDEYIPWDARDQSQTWTVTKDKGLECITCPKPSPEELAREEYRDFNELQMHGIFDVRIYHGDDYSVEIKGAEKEREKYKIFRSGKTLVIDFEGKKKFNWNLNEDAMNHDKVHISITMPDLEKIEATGFGSISFEHFVTNDMEIQLRGPIKLRGKLDAEELVLNLNGKAEADLEGRANTMNAELQFASRLKAYDLQVEEAMVEASGASTAKVNVVSRLEMEQGMGSKIDYRGTPEIIKHQ